MTAVEISNMSFDEKAKKVFELIQTNSEAKDWFSKYSECVGDGNGKFTVDFFASMFLAVWTNK